MSGTIKFPIVSAIAIAMVIMVATSTAALGWQKEPTISGIVFEKARLDKSGLTIGRLKSDTTLAGRPCRRGWVHLYTNGVPAAFTASAPIVITTNLTIPAGTWVKQNPQGVVTVCAFPKDTLVQGHLCRGSGGPTGVQAAFYPSGALKQYFLRRDAAIQKIPCKAGLLGESIELHSDGFLKAATLSANYTIDGVQMRKGDRIKLDPEGHLVGAP